MDSVELEFTDEALHAIARKTIERKTGARGLRSVMEGILLPVMYDVPNDPTIIRVTIDKGHRGGRARPIWNTALCANGIRTRPP